MSISFEDANIEQVTQYLVATIAEGIISEDELKAAVNDALEIIQELKLRDPTWRPRTAEDRKRERDAMLNIYTGKIIMRGAPGSGEIGIMEKDDKTT